MRPKANTFLCFAVYTLPLAQLFAQSESKQSFEVIMSYATAFEELQVDADELLATQRRLIKQRDDGQNRLLQSEQDLQQIRSTEALSSLQLWEANLQLQLRQLSYENVWRAFNPLRIGADGFVEPQPERTFRPDLRRWSADELRLQQLGTVQAINLGEQIKQLDLASRLIFERRQKILNLLQETGQQAQQWFIDQRTLYDRYLAQADIAGVHSEIQLKSALRQLDRADPDNLGAKVVRTITLVRLERIDEAEPLIEELAQSPTIARPVAMALQAEVLARRGETQKAQDLLDGFRGQKELPPQAIWLNAQTVQLLNDPRKAIAQWNALLRSGVNEVAAHRGLALCYCAFRERSANLKRVQREAMDHAKLANQLTGDSDWSCQLALALATAIGGDLPQAAQLAETAAESALLENQTYCLDVAQELTNGKIPAWQF